MSNDLGFQFSVFGVQKLPVISASGYLFSAFDPYEISNLKSHIRGAQGGRL